MWYRSKELILIEFFYNCFDKISKFLVKEKKIYEKF